VTILPATDHVLLGGVGVVGVVGVVVVVRRLPPPHAHRVSANAAATLFEKKRRPPTKLIRKAAW
jgi:hypothetical protein